MSSNLTATSGGDTDSSSGPKPGNNPILKKAHVTKAPALDRKSVKWSGPRNPKPQAGGRHFGLKECPTFYPTAEEFQDPMEYLRKIGDEGRGKEFGMCKVVPPEGWQMPFVLDTEVSLLGIFQYPVSDATCTSRYSAFKRDCSV
jgi:histone demethylase JARID1